MPLRILREWHAYYAAEPWSEERADWRSAMIASVMVNLWSKKRARIEDYMPQFGKASRRQPTPQELLRKLKTMNKMLGGEFTDKRG